jgi:hypothetical protein
MEIKLIVKFKYLNKVAGEYDKIKEQITILTLEWDKINDSKITEACKKMLLPYSQEFVSIIEISQLSKD